MYKYQRLQGSQGNACSSKSRVSKYGGKVRGEPRNSKPQALQSLLRGAPIGLREPSTKHGAHALAWHLPTGKGMYKSHDACPNLESNTPVAHVPKASHGQGMSPPPVSSNLGFILCRLRGIAFSKFTHPPENLTHDTCKPNAHATCGKYIKGKCMQSEKVTLMKVKSPKSTGEYESGVFHNFKTFHQGCNRHKFLIMWFIILTMMQMH
eukprot:2826507-Prymnesium_polylepis.1